MSWKPLSLQQWAHKAAHLSYVLLLATAVSHAHGATESDSSAASPSLTIESFSMPQYSAYLSQETIEGMQKQDALMQKAHALCNPYTKQTAKEIRQCETQKYSVIMPEALAKFNVDIQEQTIDGVRTHIVTPKQGLTEQNRHRVLINLHGGGFKFSGGYGGQLESMPIAERSGITVVSIDYRKAPDFRFPAANEDVEKVYRYLLNVYPPENIGIFGCSAGSRVSGQAIVHLQKVGLPNLGAAAFLCSAPTGLDGDSNYYAAAVQKRDPLHIGMVEYWEGLSPDNQDAFPGDFETTLEMFPPSLLITSTRDYSLSPMVNMHQKLVRLGKQSQLHIFEGFTHGQFMSMYVPESKETTDIMHRFFDQHLGTQALDPPPSGNQ